jgi:protein SCO1/2
MKSHYLKRALLGISLGLCIAIFAMAISFLKDKQTDVSNTTTDAPILNVAGVGGPFEMSDHNGNTITEKNLIGKYTILFFGFTYCPAICPTELQKITAAYVTLPKDVKDKLQLYFVSIDPERDTQEIMKNYVALFDPKWVGLRGDETQTNAMKKAYKVYGAKVPQGDTYTMDHSSFIYVMGPDGTLNQMFRGSDNAAKITEVLNDIVK